MGGNWTSFKEDADGNGIFSDAVDLTQTRSHNKANEITDISGEQAGQVAWADPGYDAMGNVTSYPKPSAMNNSYTCKYDAWNRLVEVKDGANLVAAYSYDGLGRRIIKKTYDSGGSLVETRQFYYNRWQVIEERVDQRQTNPQERQYVWGTQYVDELILRDRDANGAPNGDGTLEQRHYGLQDVDYSVTCIVDSSGDAAERYVYTPYGSREIRSADFSSSLSASAVGWDVGHQGLMHDANTSLVYNRARMLHPGLGRFMQRDPVPYLDGTNLYEYVASSPLQYRDPHGNVRMTPEEFDAWLNAMWKQLANVREDGGWAAIEDIERSIYDQMDAQGFLPCDPKTGKKPSFEEWRKKHLPRIKQAHMQKWGLLSALAALLVFDTVNGVSAFADSKHCATWYRNTMESLRTRQGCDSITQGNNLNECKAALQAQIASSGAASGANAIAIGEWLDSLAEKASDACKCSSCR
ncbi:RHS repeat domain-containing protein [Fontivita pretiosa]|uniref:RHS repeat domain-containing protein n=1 Tax=Fontivita pretiosa TaxID=2989684 RepID=UPI003D1722C8